MKLGPGHVRLLGTWEDILFCLHLLVVAQITLGAWIH